MPVGGCLLHLFLFFSHILYAHQHPLPGAGSPLGVALLQAPTHPSTHPLTAPSLFRRRSCRRHDDPAGFTSYCLFFRDSSAVLPSSLLPKPTFPLISFDDRCTHSSTTLNNFKNYTYTCTLYEKTKHHRVLPDAMKFYNENWVPQHRVKFITFNAETPKTSYTQSGWSIRSLGYRSTRPVLTRRARRTAASHCSRGTRRTPRGGEVLRQEEGQLGRPQDTRTTGSEWRIWRKCCSSSIPPWASSSLHSPCGPAASAGFTSSWSSGKTSRGPRRSLKSWEDLCDEHGLFLFKWYAPSGADENIFIEKGMRKNLLLLLFHPPSPSSPPPPPSRDP